MNIFSKILNAIKGFASKAFNLAKRAGLDDALVDLALRWVRVAATKFTDNAERREFVVKMLTSKGIPESIARLAVELAVRLYKAEVEPKLVRK